LQGNPAGYFYAPFFRKLKSRLEERFICRHDYDDCLACGSYRYDKNSICGSQHDNALPNRIVLIIVTIAALVADFIHLWNTIKPSSAASGTESGLWLLRYSCGYCEAIV